MSSKELADRLEIRELASRYCLAIDLGTPSDYAAVFTEDGIMDGASGYHVGREAIEKFVPPWMNRSVHTTRDSVITVDGDRGTHSVTLVTFTRAGAGEEHKVRLVAEYNDEVRRTADGWRIAHRRVRYLYHAPAVAT